MKLYTSSQAAKAAQVSSATVRSLTGGKYSAFYSGLWSPDATPVNGSARLLRESDIAMLRYIRSQTAQGRSHDAIAADIRAGALEDFAQAEEEPQEPEPPRTMIDPTMTALLQTMRDEFAAAHRHAEELQTALIDAEKRAAAAESRAQVLEAQLAERRKSWWARLRGR